MLGITEDTKISNYIKEGTNVSKDLTYTGYKDDSKQLHSRRQKRQRKKLQIVNKISKKRDNTAAQIQNSRHLDFELDSEARSARRNKVLTLRG